jgi:hypothetical protein
MKTLFLIVACIICIQLTGLAQQDSLALQKIYNSKIFEYKKIQRGSTVCSILGSVCVIGGICLIAKDDLDKDKSSTNTVGKDYNQNGTMLLSIGLPILGAGVILGYISSHKIEKYQKKLKDLSFYINYSGDIKGLTLTYNF